MAQCLRHIIASGSHRFSWTGKSKRGSFGTTDVGHRFFGHAAAAGHVLLCCCASLCCLHGDASLLSALVRQPWTDCDCTIVSAGQENTGDSGTSSFRGGRNVHHAAVGILFFVLLAMAITSLLIISDASGA